MSKRWDLGSHIFKKYIRFSWSKMCSRKNATLTNVQLKELSITKWTHPCSDKQNITRVPLTCLPHRYQYFLELPQKMLRYSQGWEPLYLRLIVFYTNFSVLIKFWGMSYESLWNTYSMLVLYLENNHLEESTLHPFVQMKTWRLKELV